MKIGSKLGVWNAPCDRLPARSHCTRGYHKMEHAYRMCDLGAATRSLKDLAKIFDAQHPGGAASLREGLEESARLFASACHLRCSERCARPHHRVDDLHWTHDDAKRQEVADAKVTERWTVPACSTRRSAVTGFRNTATSPRWGRNSFLSQGGGWIGEGSRVVLFNQWRAVSKANPRPSRHRLTLFSPSSIRPVVSDGSAS